MLNNVSHNFNNGNSSGFNYNNPIYKNPILPLNNGLESENRENRK